MEVTSTVRSFKSPGGTMSPAAGVKTVVVELSDSVAVSRALDGQDLVVHAAGTSLHGHLSAREEERMWRDNVTASSVLARLAFSEGVKRFVYLSSLSVYGKYINDVVTQHTPPMPTEAYGKSKLCAEEVINCEFSGRAILALRLPSVLGSGARRHWIARTRALMQADAPVSVFNPEVPFNNAVWIEDLSGLVKEWITDPQSTSLTAPIASTDPIRVLEVVESMRFFLNSKSSITITSYSCPSFWIDDATARLALGYQSCTTRGALQNYCLGPYD
jgi:UDP-glucose 4-epimerase